MNEEMEDEFCPSTGKRKFFSRLDAMRALKNMNRGKARGKGSVYVCKDCHCLHVTHRNYQYQKTFRDVVKHKKAVADFD